MHKHGLLGPTLASPTQVPSGAGGPTAGGGGIACRIAGHVPPYTRAHPVKGSTWVRVHGICATECGWP